MGRLAALQQSRPEPLFLMRHDENRLPPQAEERPARQARMASPVEERPEPRLLPQEPAYLQAHLRVHPLAKLLAPSSQPIGSPLQKTTTMPPPARRRRRGLPEEPRG